MNKYKYKYELKLKLKLKLKLLSNVIIFSFSLFMGMLFSYIIVFILGCYVFTSNFTSTLIKENNTNNINNANNIGNNLIPIYLMSNGVHIDIVIPAKHEIYDWTQQIQYKHTKIASSQDELLAIGWGDEGFYLNTPDWSKLKAKTVIQTLSGFNKTLMHTKYLTNQSIQHSLKTEPSNTKQLFLTKNQYQNLVKNIQNQFSKNEQGNFILTNTQIRYSNKDSFYNANNHYTLYQTCNTWINELLKKSEQNSCLWTPFSHCILEKYPTN